MSTLSTLIICWYCKHTASQASKNTLWCLLGCCIGNFGIIGYFLFIKIDWPVSLIMTIAIINGLITSIILERIILLKHKITKFNIDIYVINKHFDHVFIKI